MREFPKLYAAAVLLLGFTAAAAMGDTYRFAAAEDSNWANGRNWQNQTAGVNGWTVAGGIALPGAADNVRFNYAASAGILSTDAGTVDGLQIGVDEGGSLTLNPGAVLTTASGGWSGMGAGGGTTGSLTINGGLLTVNDGWKMGVNDNLHTVALEINGGEMRVASAFTQIKTTTTATTTLKGGLLDVDSMSLSAGTVNLAGGTLVIRGGDRRAEVSSWVSSGWMTAYGGVGGATVLAVFSNGVTTVNASALPNATVPDVTGQPRVVAEANIVSAGLTVGTVSYTSGLPGSPVPGTVHSQSPAGGTVAVSGSAVDLEVVDPALPPLDVEELSPTTGNSEGAFITTSYAGRTVWQTTNPNGMLYFRVPASFDFTEGSPVYVRIEYHDSGSGMLFAEYDSSLGSTTAYKFRDAELHARSSRVATGAFVYNFQLFEAPLFNRRQNGQNDFRIQVKSSDGTPLRVAGAQISNRPFDDEKFLYVLSRPWLEPYSGETHDFTDASTLVGKVMTGYQGWFGTPNDAADAGWKHWTRGSGSVPSPTEMTVDMWPWLNEYSTADLYPAGTMAMGDGRPAYLFSSRDPETVRRHFRWMRKHNIDGAYLQRFVSRGSSGYYGAEEFVLSNVRAAANQEGRVWAIEYDVSSLTGEANPLEVISNDWNFLVNDCHILDDPRYAHEAGKPVLFIWGFSVPGREGLTLAEADAILDWFGTKNLYLIGGVHSSWESNTAWYGHYQKYDQLLAWMERTKTDLQSQKARLDSWGMKILPHAWPGFSWNNLKQTVFPYQYTARAGGQFYWDKLYNAVAIGADQIFLGMFDEYDEGTAIMPMSDTPPVPHTEWGHYLDNEGLDPFWYLRLSGAARDMLNGLRPLTATVPPESAVPASALAGAVASVLLGGVDVSSGVFHPQPADGITEPAWVGGRNCRTNRTAYFYFDIEDSLCFEHPFGQAATIEIDFYDNYPGSTFTLQYDALNNAYRNSGTIAPSASNGWKTARWTVPDGFFGNRQNAGADFRIAVSGAAAISEARVIFPEEQGGSAVADAPVIDTSSGWMEWPVLSDAAGWRLYENGSLTSNGWNEVAGPFVFTNGVVQYGSAATNGAGFYRLQRPARQ